MRFLIDADLPRSVGVTIRKFGHETVDVRDIGLRSAKDPVIAHYAKTEKYCLITGRLAIIEVGRIRLRGPIHK